MSAKFGYAEILKSMIMVLNQNEMEIFFLILVKVISPQH